MAQAMQLAQLTRQESRAIIAKRSSEVKYQQAEARIKVGIGQHEEEIHGYQRLRQAEQTTYQQLSLARASEHRSIGLYNEASSEIAALKQNVNHPQTAHETHELRA